MHGSLEALEPVLRMYNQVFGYGIFATVNRTDGKGREEANITHLRSFYADFDKGFPESCALPPTRIVQSSPGKGYYYWDLLEPLPCSPELNREYRGIMTSLVKTLGADTNAKDIARVLRMPLYANTKYASLPIVAETFNGGPRYTMKEIRDAFGYLEQATGAARTASTDEEVLRDRFMQSLLKYPPPATGQKESNAWMYKAASWGIGNLGLSVDAVIEVLDELNGMEWDGRFDDAEIITTARNAAKYARKLKPATVEVKL